MVKLAWEDLAEHVLSTVTADDLETAFLPAVPAITWLTGRTSVFYDRDVLSSLGPTPLDQRIPVEALYRLPGWSLYLHCPFIHPEAGVFACLDPGEVHGACESTRIPR